MVTRTALIGPFDKVFKLVIGEVIPVLKTTQNVVETNYAKLLII